VTGDGLRRRRRASAGRASLGQAGFRLQVVRLGSGNNCFGRIGCRRSTLDWIVVLVLEIRGSCESDFK